MSQPDQHDHAHRDRHERHAANHDLSQRVAEVGQRQRRGDRPQPGRELVQRKEDPRQEHQRKLQDARDHVGRLFRGSEGGHHVADRDEYEGAKDDEEHDLERAAEDRDGEQDRSDPDDDRGLAEGDGEPHDHVAADERPAAQGRGAQPLEDELLALLDQRDRPEEPELHERHREDARHEVGDRGDAGRLDRLGLER